MKVRRKQKLDVPFDYSLPNLYYFSGNLLREISRELAKLSSILNKAGFQECHFPFLVPRSVLLNYKGLVSLNNYIKVYSGKDRRSYAYLRPDGIFSQGVILAGKIIKSYRDLPLKLFEISPGYTKMGSKDKRDIFTSPEQSFSAQCGVFAQDDSAEKFCRLLLSNILKEFSIKYTTQKTELSKGRSVQYVTQANGNQITVAKFYVFEQEVTKRANIYFFDKKGQLAFPYMCTFSLSQNILLLDILADKKRK
jgi:hypothetical protein